MKQSFVVAMSLLFMAAPWAHSEKAATYVGSGQCAPCHQDICTAWQKTRHARAIESLKKSKQETLPACVQCHVTGYEQEGGYIDYDLTPEMAGVQCESCHGPGSNHAADPSAAVKKDPGTELCRQCHTEAQDPGFQYDAKVKEVHSVAQ